MSKHTPGPWAAVKPIAIDYRAMQIQTDESLIAVCCGGGPKRAISAPEERANARLIAAAPDLRAVAEQVINVLYEASGGKPEDLPEAEYELWNAARAAIAKAEGLNEVGEQGTAKR